MGIRGRWSMAGYSCSRRREGDIRILGSRCVDYVASAQSMDTSCSSKTGQTRGDLGTSSGSEWKQMASWWELGDGYDGHCEMGSTFEDRRRYPELGGSVQNCGSWLLSCTERFRSLLEFMVKYDGVPGRPGITLLRNVFFSPFRCHVLY